MGLLITKELLDEYNACESGKKYMDRFYPQGASCIDLIHDKHIPIDFLHWGFRMLPVSADEITEYEKRVELEKCFGYFECQRCKDSRNILKSKDVENSFLVCISDNVVNSSNVMSCSNIKDCVDVFYSVQLRDCSQVMNGRSLENCHNVHLGSYSKNCVGLVRSEFCFNSQNILNSKQMESCDFCADCANLKNSLFCFQVDGGENLIFNKPASPEIIEMARTEFEQLGDDSLTISSCWDPQYIMLAPKVNIDPRDLFADFPDSLWEFVSHLPNFNPQILYNITFLSRLLEQN